MPPPHPPHTAPAPPRIRIKLGEYMRLRNLIHPPGAKHAGSPNLYQLARLTGMGYSQLYRIVADPHAAEMGITLRSLGRLCDALGCTPSDLLEYIPPDPTSVNTHIGPQRAVGTTVLTPDW